MENSAQSGNLEPQRNILQAKIMTCLYQYLFYSSISETPSIDTIMTDVFATSLNDISDYARRVLYAAAARLDEAKKILAPQLHKFRFERLSLVEQAILVMAYIENRYFAQPKAIAINVAVRLSRKYADEKSYKFINGVLEKVCQK